MVANDSSRHRMVFDFSSSALRSLFSTWPTESFVVLAMIKPSEFANCFEMHLFPHPSLRHPHTFFARDLIDDMISTVDIECFASDETRCVVREKGNRGAHVIDADEAAGGRL